MWVFMLVGIQVSNRLLRWVDGDWLVFVMRWCFVSTAISTLVNPVYDFAVILNHELYTLIRIFSLASER